MPSNEQNPTYREGSSPPEGHAYAPGTRPADSGGLYAESGDRGKEGEKDMGERGREMGERAKEGVSAVADRGMEQSEKARESSAEGMSKAADQMRERLGDQDNIAGTVANKTADSLERASDYMKNHDNREMMHDLEAYVREHPYQAMVGALAAGFVISRVLR